MNHPPRPAHTARLPGSPTHRDTEHPPRLSAARLAAMAAALSVPDGGFTIDPATGTDARTGYAVSVHPECEHTYDRPVTADDLTAYLTRTRHTLALAGRVFGGWRDPDTGRVHLDVSAVVPTLDIALHLGRHAGQHAVFDLAAGQSIPIPHTTHAEETPDEPAPTRTVSSPPEGTAAMPPRHHRTHRVPNPRRHLTPVPDPAPTDHATQDRPAVFSPGRLRAHRDLHGYTRTALGERTGLTADTITAYEEDTATPPADHVHALADALNLDPHALTGPPGADDSWEYWGLICAAMPPMTAEQIATVATVLRRIDKHREHHPHNRPDDPPADYPHAA